MPSATFFRLPEEKRQRLTDAAWAEMLSVRFDKVSINRIIQNAGISRGSFYQYFSDKQDLLHFLFEQIHDELRASALPPGGEGDWLAACLAGYVWVVERRADPRLRLSDVIRFAQINPEMDLPLPLDDIDGMGSALPPLCGGAPALREAGVTEQDYQDLICFLVGGAVLQSFRRPGESAAIREQLRKQLLILKCGMDALGLKGET